MRYICTSIVAALMLAATSATFAASIECTQQQIAKLTADDGATYDCFGSSVSIDAGVAVIGAQRTDTPDSNPGSAYVFEQQADGAWQQTAKLTADDGASYDFFGWSVALDAGVAVIGAYGDDDNGTDSGSAYVYEQQGDGTWQQTAKLTADDAASGDYFGSSVSTSGGVAVIGAYRDDNDGGDNSGSAYVYEQQGDGTWQQTAKLTADDAASGDYFGSSVSIDTGVAVIGAYWDDAPGHDSGSAYVFEQQADGTWQQTAKLTADDGTGEDWFGYSVSNSGGVAVIGAQRADAPDSDSGSAYVYEQQGDGTWQQTAKLTADDAASGDYFGSSVATSDGVAVIGAHYDDDNGNDSGSAYAFEQQADGAWQQTAKLTADDGAAEDKFGYSVATSGGVAVIGSKDDDGDNGGYSFGSAYVYNYLSVIDCNDNGVSDVCDLTDGTSFDCDQNGVPDECQPDCDGDGWIDACDSDADVDGDGIPDNCETDCNSNTIPDHFEIEMGWVNDCDGNLIPDECDIANDPSLDCNGNGAHDICDIAEGIASDCNDNGTPDECDLAFAVPDGAVRWTVAEGGTGHWYQLVLISNVWDTATEAAEAQGGYLVSILSEGESDFVNALSYPAAGDGPVTIGAVRHAGGNDNTQNWLWASGESWGFTNWDAGIPNDPPDNLSWAIINPAGLWDDWNDGASIDPNSIVIEYENDASGFDCDGNSLMDLCELNDDPSLDCDGNGVLDVCQTLDDCNENGIPDGCDLQDPANDQNNNGALDECECIADINGDGVVSVDDMLAIIGYWASAVTAGDLNFDGTVDIEDLLLVLSAWGPCP